MTCEHNKPGQYDFRCIDCMARLIRSARPKRALQEGHIAALARFHKGEWPYIWHEVKKRLEE